MEIETKMAPHVSQEDTVSVKPKRAPTFYAIIFFKIAKGLLAIFLATVLYFQPASKLPTEYEHLMGRPTVQKVFYYLRIHPENKFFEHLARQIDAATDAGIRAAAVGALLWSLFPLTEGIGMIFRVRWAGWLAIGESAFFVPVELFKLVENFSWFMVLVTIINAGIVWYLYVNRERLFYEAHHYRNLRHPERADNYDHPVP